MVGGEAQPLIFCSTTDNLLYRIIENRAFSQRSKPERGILMYEITVMTDEEFDDFQKEQRKRAVLTELRKLSRPTTKGKSFSIKDVAKEDPTPATKSSNESNLHIVPDSSKDDDWDGFITSLRERAFSPIDESIDESFSDFKVNLRDPTGEDDNYSDVFKKETAMMSEVLRDVKAIAKDVGKDITRITRAKKGTDRGAGVTKSYSDLIDAYNGIIHNEFQLIKGIADFKAKQTEWAIKDRDKKNAATNGEQSVDALVNQYYSKVMNGGLQNYNNAATATYQYDPNFAYTEIEEPATQPSIQDVTETEDTSGIDSVILSTGFNITQPLVGSRVQDDYYREIAGDAHGHIIHEQANVEICVFQYGEHYEFAAIGEDGEPVDGVELPSDADPGILATLQARPGSDYVYDKYGRKYRVFDKTNVDISDIDDMEYPFDSDEDR